MTSASRTKRRIGRKARSLAELIERNAWAERHMITSTRGRVWTRNMVYSAVMRELRKVPGCASGQGVEHSVTSVLDDASWMRRRKGEVPRAVVRAICARIFPAIYW